MSSTDKGLTRRIIPRLDRGGWAAALMSGAIALVYANSLSVPFVFDDPLAIVENPTIRRLWPLSDVLMPPRGEGFTVEGRPVLNLTLALNYAWGGTAVRGYHVVNVVIHMAAALTLFGVLRRTFLLSSIAARFRAHALPLSLLIALLWALHPLQTASVTYVIQRAEALASLFYLFTLYSFIRATTDSAPRDHLHPGWTLSTVVACAVGMATKEIMVSAPLLILLFDRAFLSGNFLSAARTHGRLHILLFATWILLGALVLSTGTRGGTAGFGINVTPWQYALTQFEAVSRYVWLSFWPHPLIFDYGAQWVRDPVSVLPFALVVLGMLGATFVAWWRSPKFAWAALLFFAVLSPTSSFVPGNRQTLAEHRMYLPLASLLGMAVSGLFAVGQEPRARRGLFLGGATVVVAFGLLTVRRNLDYASEVTLYRDTALKRPSNGFARYNLGKVYAETGQHEGALAEYDAALRLIPDSPGIHYNWANSLVALGRTAEALSHYTAAIAAAPQYGRAHFNLGNLLLEAGRKDEAARHFAAATEAEPAFLEARVNLGGVLLDLGRLAEARTQLERVLQTEPSHVFALFNLGNVALLEGRNRDAAALFSRVIALRPDLVVARERLEQARRPGLP